MKMERKAKIKGKMGIRGEEIESFTEKLGRRRWREEKEGERKKCRKKERKKKEIRERGIKLAS